MDRNEYDLSGFFFRKSDEPVEDTRGRIPYARRLPARRIPKTEREKLNYWIHERVMDFLEPLEAVFEVGMRHYQDGKRGLHAAVHHAYTVSLFRDGYGSAIDPWMVAISVGRLIMPYSFKLHFNRDSWEIGVSWDPDPPKAYPGEVAGQADDRLMLVAYSGWDTGEVFADMDAARRSEGKACIQVRRDCPTSYFVYVAFRSADGSVHSSTTCIDQLEID